MEFLSDARQDVYRPSIFELIAQEQLRDLLQPAVKYVLAVSSRPPFRTFLSVRPGICATIPKISYQDI
jgi:peroxin-12